MNENNSFNMPIGMSDPNFMTTNLLSNTTSNCQTQPHLLDFNTQCQIMPHLQGEFMNFPQNSNHIGRNTVANPSLDESNLIGNAEFDERFCNESGMLVSASSLAAILASRFSNSIPNHVGYDTIYGEMNNNWIDRNQWLSSSSSIINSSNPCGSSQFDKELSLSLAMCQHPIVRGTVIPDQCSEISGSRKEVQMAQFSSGSRYLGVIQEILAQLASYSLEHFDQVNHPSTLTKNSLSRSCLSGGDYSMMDSDADGGFCATRGREVEGKKQQLMALLEVVDEQHNQCLDEIHTVISAFHAATELDPRIHARFALQTVSVMYKNLREKISNQILTLGASPRNGEKRENEMSFETSFIHKQWALQQLRKKDHQLWRPQRGLPEKSVLVLRAWMFQNFLHPYPKDTEKHLLAVKSGLTRSQVSNWFINARVRLWKPMIEEMYSEMNRRNGRRNVDDSNNGHKSHITIDNLRFDM